MLDNPWFLPTLESVPQCILTPCLEYPRSYDECNLAPQMHPNKLSGSMFLEVGLADVWELWIGNHILGPHSRFRLGHGGFPVGIVQIQELQSRDPILDTRQHLQFYGSETKRTSPTAMFRHLRSKADGQPGPQPHELPAEAEGRAKADG